MEPHNVIGSIFGYLKILNSNGKTLFIFSILQVFYTLLIPTLDGAVMNFLVPPKSTSINILRQDVLYRKFYL